MLTGRGAARSVGPSASLSPSLSQSPVGCACRRAIPVPWPPTKSRELKIILNYGRTLTFASGGWMRHCQSHAGTQQGWQACRQTDRQTDRHDGTHTLRSRSLTHSVSQSLTHSLALSVRIPSSRLCKAPSIPLHTISLPIARPLSFSLVLSFRAGAVASRNETASLTG